MFSEAEKEGLRQSFRSIVPVADLAAETFFERLFDLAPECRHLFPEELTVAKQLFLRLLACFANGLSWHENDWKADVSPEEDVMLIALGLGRYVSEHYQLPPGIYASVEQAWLVTLEKLPGPLRPENAQRLWSRALILVARTMAMGSTAIDRDAALLAPEHAIRMGERVLAEHRSRIPLEPTPASRPEDAQ
ncbi:MAG TPA: hypothetical protein VIM73_19330 [Polyangiaceae bacterium]